MQTAIRTSPDEPVGVSLVDGESGVRHARQLMLRSEGYAVRSYPTCAALIADPRSRDFPCIILDLEMEAIDGPALLRDMRATGWRGKALLLDVACPRSGARRDVGGHGDMLLPRDVGDRALLAAIAASIDHGWAGWHAEG